MVHVWFLDTVHPALEQALREAGMICHDGTHLTREDMLAANTLAEPVHGLVLRSRLTLDAALLDALPDLQWVARSGSGLENIDVVHAERRGVVVHNSPEGNRVAVGEHTLGMLLSLLNHLRSGDASIRQRQWQREAHRGRELQSMTVGIYGYGHMGSAVAERLAGFGCRVMAYDKHRPLWGESPVVERPLPHVEPVGLQVLQQEADIVSLHLPWTDETKGLVDDAWLSAWRKPLVLLNTSRGAIVQTAALLRALDDGKVVAAGLDVLEFEGRSLERLDGLADLEARQTFETLLQRGDVLLSPHVAGWTNESWIKLSTVLAAKILGRPHPEIHSTKNPGQGQGF
jgi:D-3-phosphoglycerate dehydrogenase